MLPDIFALPAFSLSLSDPFWLLLAFAMGIGSRSVGLPPMVGYLLAGFALAAYGAQAGDFLNGVADLGITLMLFTIGLKISLKSLKAPEILGVATLHMLLTCVVASIFVMIVGLLGIALFDGISWQTAALVAFALSFSSTVFAVKVLEEKGEMTSYHGRIAIGILVIQDIVAVVFMAASSGTLPSLYALGLFGLIFLRRPLDMIARRAGHGELLLLFGFAMTLAGYALFEALGVKGDLGALIFGMLLAGSAKASELNKALGNFKDIFLIGFFLTIGQAGLPDLSIAITALILMVFLVAKTGLWLVLFSRFHLRARGNFLSTLTLANYSEFALIVAAVAVQAGWLEPAWLVALAVCVALSFVVAAPLNSASNSLFTRLRPNLTRMESSRIQAKDLPIDLTGTQVLIFGMGRIGTATFANLQAEDGANVLGFDVDSEVIERHQRQGRQVLQGDANDPELWARLSGFTQRIRLVVLATPYLQSNLPAIALLRAQGYSNAIATIAHYGDDEAELRQAGADSVYNIYKEAGDGIAQEIEALLKLHPAA